MVPCSTTDGPAAAAAAVPHRTRYHQSALRINIGPAVAAAIPHCIRRLRRAAATAVPVHLLPSTCEYIIFNIIISCNIGSGIGLMKNEFLDVYFKFINSFNATVRMSPVLFWRASRLHSSMKGLPLTNVTNAK